MMTFKEFLAMQTVKPNSLGVKNQGMGMQVLKDLRDKDQLSYKKQLPDAAKAVHPPAPPSPVSPETKRKWGTNFTNRFKIRGGSSLDISSL